MLERLAALRRQHEEAAAAAAAAAAAGRGGGGGGSSAGEKQHQEGRIPGATAGPEDGRAAAASARLLRRHAFPEPRGGAGARGATRALRGGGGGNSLTLSSAPGGGAPTYSAMATSATTRAPALTWAQADRERRDAELQQRASPAGGGDGGGGGCGDTFGETVARLQALRSKGHALLSTP